MALTKDEIQSTLTTMTAELLGVNESDIGTEKDFVDDLGADSLDQVELLMGIEEEFDLDILDVEAEKILTLEHAVNYVLENQ